MPDESRRPCNSAGHERFAPAGRFMIEKNSVTGEQVVRLALVCGVPMYLAPLAEQKLGEAGIVLVSDT